MPNVGQDKYGSAPREARSRTIEQMRAVRGGQWGRVPEDKSASGKSFEKRMMTTRDVRSGQWGRIPQDDSASGKSFGLRGSQRQAVRRGDYFKNNVGEKRSALVKRDLERWNAINDAMKRE